MTDGNKSAYLDNMMADGDIKVVGNTKKKKRQEPKKRMEDFSRDELEAQINEDKRKAARSMILAFSALVAIVFACIAWFASNRVVTGIVGSVTVNNETKFQLASIGDRHESETEHFWSQDKNSPKLLEGQGFSITKYYDIENKKIVEDSTGNALTAYIGNSNLAWRLSDKKMTLEPGAFGKFEFYIIPKLEGLDTMKVSIQLQPYKADNNSTDGTSTGSAGGGSNTSSDARPIVAPNAKAVPINDIDLNNLIYGHVLMFRNLDTKDGYSDRIELNNNMNTDVTSLSYEFEIKASDYMTNLSAEGSGSSAEFEKDLPYKVCIYWIWPKYFRNYVFKNRIMHGDLFTEKTSAKDYKSLNDFINSQKNKIGKNTGNKLFYLNTYETESENGSEETGNSSTSTNSDAIEGDINSDMNAGLLNKCSEYYNQADIYIGCNADFLYINATVE